MSTLRSKTSISRSPSPLPLLFIPLVLACFTPLQRAQGVVPPPDGCYPNLTTAEGCNALQSLTTGAANTAIGWRSLFSNSTGSYNTGLGVGALLLNTGDSNTATGVAALLLNTTGYENTATGITALENNTTGFLNTATGSYALFTNTNGTKNTATGAFALHANNNGSENTANGYSALGNNIGGYFNTAIGTLALLTNTNGGSNTAVGWGALIGNNVGDDNTAVGDVALHNNTGDSNTAIGDAAGYNLTTGSGNVCVGEGVQGAAGASNTTWIRNVHNSVATARQVYVNADNKIGTLSSSRRYKEQIEPMDKASETLFALRPVTFRYKKEVDPGQAPSFGLIAEEVAQVSPELVTPDQEGKAQTVRYEAVNAMLLNEFLKAHRTVQEQKATIAQLKSTDAKQEATIAKQQKQIDALTAGLQKVSAQIEASKPAPQVVNNP